MHKKNLIILLLGLLLVLAACAPAATPTPIQAPQGFTGGGNVPGNGGNGGNNPLPLNDETKLAIGIFKLEGTSNAVTSAEAKTLLPLWEQAQTLNAGGSAAQTDLQTVYDKILGALTADQASAIDGMNLTQADVQTMMQQLGIQITPGAFGGVNGGTPFPTISADERATRTAQRQTQVASNGGTPVAGGGNPGFSGTPGAGRGGAGFGFANMFIDPLVKLLQTRAGG